MLEGGEFKQMTPIVVGLVSGLLIPVSGVVGYRLGGRSRAWGHWTIGLALAGVAGVLLAAHWPEWIIKRGGSRLYLWLTPIGVVWPAMVFFFAAIRHLPRRQTARLVAIFTILAGVFFLFCSLRLVFPGYRGLSDRVVEEYCIQTTSWSCGPAAGATLLAHLGIAASEREMAYRCGAFPYRGTSDYGLWHGLRQSLPEDGYDVELVRPSWDELDELPTPFLITVKLKPWLNHVVCVLAVNEEFFVIADPSRLVIGEYPAAHVREKWREIAIVVRPRGANIGYFRRS
jgi:predicted double-glycine peptidase